MNCKKPLIALLGPAIAVGLSTASPATAASSAPIDFNLKRNATCAAPENVPYVNNCWGQKEASYIASSWPKAGTITVAGTRFSWPATGLQVADSIAAQSQTLAVKGSKGYRSVALLVAGHRGDRTGEVTVTYTDGSSVRRKIAAPDWFVPRGMSALKGIRVQQFVGAVNVLGGGEGGIFLAVAPIDRNKVVKSIKLPSASAQMIVFAASLSPLASQPAKGPLFR